MTVPEVLIGDAPLIRAAIRAAPGQLKYRSGVLSFAPEDMDVCRFNDGDKDLRGAVNLALTLWMEIAFVGIPEAGRPPAFVTTHTHVGRLEVNLLTPRWVLRPDGHIRACNPDPPGPASRAIWRAFQDLLNLRFGWADAGAPERRRLVQLPDWTAKLRKGRISCRADVLRWLKETSSRCMMVEAFAQIDKEEIGPLLSITTKAA